MATSVDPKITAFLTKIATKLQGLNNETEITEAKLDEIVKGDTTLTTELGALTKADVAAEAKKQFTTYVDGQITNIKTGFAGNTPTYKPNQKEVVIPLRGLTVDPASLTSLVKDGITKAEISGTNLKLTIDTTKPLPSNFEIDGTYKGKTEKFQIGLNRTPLSSPPPVALASKVAKFTLDDGVTLEKATVDTYNANAANPFTITVSGKDVTFTRKDDKTVSANTDVTLDVSAGGKTDEKLKFTIKPEGADAAEESGGIAGWAMSNWKLLTGVVAGLVGLFASSREEGGGYLGTALGAIGGLLVAWNYGLGGASAEEAKPAKP